MKMKRNRHTGKTGKRLMVPAEVDAIFVDAQAMHKKHPDTFEAPSMEDIRKIKPGNWVKVSAGNERFWIKVLDRKMFTIIGQVDNELINTGEHGLRLGDIVVFHQNCVYSIMQA
jgi:hypothetical protein